MPALPILSRSRLLPSPSPRWLRLAIGVAMVAIIAQLLAMAQLAKYQVERGVQLRQAIAMLPADLSRAEPGAAAALAQAQLQGAAGQVPPVRYAQR